MEREAMSGFAEENENRRVALRKENGDRRVVLRRESGNRAGKKSGNFWRIFCSPVFYRPLPAARFQRIK